MKRPKFKSVFKDEINAFIDAKIVAGFQERSFTIWLSVFDHFCEKMDLSIPVFTRDLADEWYKRRKGEAMTTHYSRINFGKHFLLYLRNQGYGVYVTRDISFKKTQFQPHIYTEDEVRSYFQAVDKFKSKFNKKCALQYPVLFRLLYCCGTRIDEALKIQKKDVNLEAGIIKLVKTKNNSERFVIVGDDLLSLFKSFASKCFYLLNDDDYIFTSTNGGCCHYDTIYEHHRLFLKLANIPYIGDSQGPRIHDWRHTFAVNAFRQMIDSGMDMYVALPILSTFLGHKTIFATEGYVRLTLATFPYIEKKFKTKLNEVFGHVGNEQ